MRHQWLTGLSLMVSTVVLTGCSAEQQAQRQLDAAIRDLDEEIVTEPHGYASSTGDGPFPDPHVAFFEVTPVEGADLVEVGAQLNMLREDHEIGADVRLGGDKIFRTEEHVSRASDFTDKQWAGVLGLVIEEDLTLAVLEEDRDTDQPVLSLHFESDDYQEAVEGFLSWQELEPPEGVRAMWGFLEFPGTGADPEITMEKPRIQLSGPLSEGPALVGLVEDAVEYQGWHEVRRLDLSRFGGDGARFEMEVRLDAGRTGLDEAERLTEVSEPFRVAESFADKVEADLELPGQMDIRITAGSPGPALVQRGSFAGDLTPEEQNAKQVENRENN